MTAILNAYLHRFTSDKLSELRDELRQRGYAGPLMLVHNTGGMANLARTAPLQTMHAGPVAGLFGSRKMAETLSFEKVVTTDMGGTSFDIGVVVAGSVRFYEFNPVVDRWRVQMPMMDIKAVGAGGGSIAKYEPHAGLTVGPRSAGSNPGPACYGRGGTEATTTDANLILGYLDPDYYHGGAMKLDRRRAERAIDRNVARPMGTDVLEAARAIRAVVDNNMADAIFKEIVLKGYDPREFVMFSYGGGGPLHACGYADVLGVTKVVVPPNSPVFSASGAAGLDLLHIYERSQHCVLFDPLFKTILEDWGPFNATVDAFVEQARQDFADDGLPADDIDYQLELDVRSGNQLYVTTIKSPVLRIGSKEDLAAILQAYFAEYSDRFGEFAVTREVGVSVETIRLRASVAQARWDVTEWPAPDYDVEATRRGVRDCYWQRSRSLEPTPVYDYDRIGAGHEIHGPAVLEGPDTTVLVYPEWTARMDEFGFLSLAKEGTDA
jgi:N-methylhydantoinase A